MSEKIPRGGDKALTVHQGDRITIRTHGFTISGTVLSAIFFESSDGWYVVTALDDGGCSYWKQGLDGGEIVSVVPRS